MSSRLHKHARMVSGWLTLTLSVVCAVLIGYGMTGNYGEQLSARLLPVEMRSEVPWKTIRAEDVAKGISAPPHTNILLHLPYGIEPITRRTLFGRGGKEVRYWGYCFPKDATKFDRIPKDGLPGNIFLSEKEQEAMKLLMKKQQPATYSSLQNVTDDELNQTDKLTGIIRHQKEKFQEGDICYLMTETPLPVGLDEDGDGANTKLEAEYRTNPKLADTDGDGIADGLEIFGLKTDATIRDTDGDGLIDGIEDKNHNGRRDLGESSPTNPDSDGDDLCDGYCVLEYNIRTGFSAPVGYVPDFSNKIVWEDKNLDGVLDEGETSPTKTDTDGDGILDEQEFFLCYIQTDSAEDCGI